MKIRIKPRGIRGKWLVNLLSMIAAVLIVLEIVACIFISSVITSSAKQKASELCSGYNGLATCDYRNFQSLAREYVENFEHKDQIQIDIIDRSGKVILSTCGFAVNDDMPDYTAAKASPTGYATRNITSSVGEQVMAGTYILADFGDGSNGAVRWSISLERINIRILIFQLVSIALGILIFAFSFFSGRYFINSIVRPLQEIGNVSYRIAMGDFKARLDIKSDDEIGVLCDGINYMASELEQSDNLKNDFISSVSHELRTPLTAIRGWTETAKLSLNDGDTEVVGKALDVVLTESERLSGLVEDLLDFSRMQSGNLSVNMQSLNLNEPLVEVVNMYAELAKEKQIQLVLRTSDSLPFVLGDRDRLKQVFINVIDNAVKYTNSGGQVLINAYTEEACVTVKVIDTGEGIAQNDLDRVKEKFFRANTTVRGSGIGLAVADEIMKQHNGLLFLESQESVGTTVTVVLPLAPQDAENEETVEAEPFAPGSEPIATETPQPQDGENTEISEEQI
ncbi:MAG: HAMP domain-containing histidine kinase [Oscillospiraceae bacterium]|nr:HAMP domain-containing histidine kinase [Candidatus Equicaccousia limihippi]